MNLIRRLWNWLAEARVPIMCLLVIYLAFHLGFIMWHTENSARIAGYGLQVIGMVFAIRGLLSIREHFNQPLLRHLFIDWLKRFPLRKQVHTLHGEGVMSTLSVSNANIEVWTPDKPGAPIADRIADIVKNLDRLREGQRISRQSIDELKSAHEKHEKEIHERTAQIETSIKSELETLHQRHHHVVGWFSVVNRRYHLQHLGTRIKPPV